jgi:hypothetical protein
VLAELFARTSSHVHHSDPACRAISSRCASRTRGILRRCTLHDLGTTCPIAFRIRKDSFCELPAGAESCHDCAPHAEGAGDRENAEALELFREDFRNELALAKRVIVPSRAHRAAVLVHHPAIAGKIRVVPRGDRALNPGSGPRVGRIRSGTGATSQSSRDRHPPRGRGSLPGGQGPDRVHVFGKIVYPMADEALAREAGATPHGPYVPPTRRSRSTSP